MKSLTSVSLAGGVTSCSADASEVATGHTVDALDEPAQIEDPARCSRLERSVAYSLHGFCSGRCGGRRWFRSERSAECSADGRGGGSCAHAHGVVRQPDRAPNNPWTVHADHRRHRVAHARASFGGFRISATTDFVPLWSAVTIDETEQRFVIGVT
jgi:hypothetical protein